MLVYIPIHFANAQARLSARQLRLSILPLQRCLLEPSTLCYDSADLM